MLRVVLDTNVLVSALLKPNSTSDLCLRLVLSDKVKLIISKEILSEYHTVLSYSKFGFQKINIDNIIERLLKIGENVEQNIKLGKITIDPTDQKFLEAGFVADFIITGNKKHFPINFNHALIVSPTEFIENNVFKIDLQ